MIYLSAFRNKQGGTDTYAVEVKATENSGHVSVSLWTLKSMNDWLILILPQCYWQSNVKLNQLYYAWLTPQKLLG